LSSLVVNVQAISDVAPHPNADRLELAIIGGWQCVVPKGKYQTGDKIVYFPPDTLIPRTLAESLGVTQYLSFAKDNPDMGRIRCAKLRGEPSFGLVADPDCKEWAIGQDVAEHYGAEKWIPPVKFTAGDAEPDHPLFVYYTNIENLRNFPNVLREGENLYITEKLDGTNCRVGMIDGELMAGSHRVRRKEPEDYASNRYWFPLSLPSVRNLLACLSREHKQVILFGEVFGKGIQKLEYGQKGLAFNAFDLLVDGKYLNAHEFLETMYNYSIPHVPTLGFGPFTVGAIINLAKGKSTIEGSSHIKEGVVVRPIYERTDPRVGRVILKYVSDEYLLSQKEDWTDA
jgi:RNA ligase (TIGR02306 family)